MGIEGMYLNIIEAIYDKPTASVILNSKNISSSKIRNKTRMSTLATFIQHSTRKLNTSQSIQTRKRNKGIPIEKEKVKFSLFADDIIYVENPKGFTKKLLEIISKFSKDAGYKTKIQKSFALIYTNKLSEREIKKTISFTIESKRIKYLGINLMKEVKCLYTKTIRH